MIKDEPFGEFLKDLEIPGNHSLFAAAYGKNAWGETDYSGENGFRLMTLKEAENFAVCGKNLPWFYLELKRRYENIYYFFSIL